MANLWCQTKNKSTTQKVKKQKAVIGILAFEIAKVMCKLLRLWKSLSEERLDRLRQKILNSVAIKKLVSDDDDFILGLISREFFEDVVSLEKYVAWLGKNHCSDPGLKGFEHAASDWIHNGADPYGWQLSREDMEREANIMEEFISKNADLYDGMKLLPDLENTLKNITATLDGPILLEFQNKVELKRHEVDKLKEVSLWNMTYDYVGTLLARSIFTIFSRIKHVFGLPKRIDSGDQISPSQSASNKRLLGSIPSIFSKQKMLDDAPPDTLGAADLALHYAKIVIKLERLIRCPLWCGTDRHRLYIMLPASIRSELNERLPEGSTSLPHCIEEDRKAIREAAIEVIEWLAPLAHDMKRWQSKRRFRKKAHVSRNYVLQVQTLYFANRQKTEATITDLLVGLHYIYLESNKISCLPKIRTIRSRYATPGSARPSAQRHEWKTLHPLQTNSSNRLWSLEALLNSRTGRSRRLIWRQTPPGGAGEPHSVAAWRWWWSRLLVALLLMVARRLVRVLWRLELQSMEEPRLIAGGVALLLMGMAALVALIYGASSNGLGLGAIVQLAPARTYVHA